MIFETGKYFFKGYNFFVLRKSNFLEGNRAFSSGVTMCQFLTHLSRPATPKLERGCVHEKNRRDKGAKNMA